MVDVDSFHYIFKLFNECFFDYTQAWICFAAVTNITSEYYNVTVDDVNWLSLIYLVVAVPIGFVASWALDTLG